VKDISLIFDYIVHLKPNRRRQQAEDDIACCRDKSNEALQNKSLQRKSQQNRLHMNLSKE
jgi:hypothetical protein